MRIIRSFISAILLLLLHGTAFSQEGRTAGTTTLNPTNCPTLYPQPAYDLCAASPATIQPVVNAPASATIVYQWNVPAGAAVSGGYNQRELVTASGGVYSVTASNASTGCSYFATYTVNACPVGLHETALNDGTFLFPNPCLNELHLQLKEDAEYELVDLSGLKVLSGYCEKGSRTVDLHALKPGCYLLQLRFAEGRQTWRMLKQ